MIECGNPTIEPAQQSKRRPGPTISPPGQHASTLESGPRRRRPPAPKTPPGPAPPHPRSPPGSRASGRRLRAPCPPRDRRRRPHRALRRRARAAPGPHPSRNGAPRRPSGAGRAPNPLPRTAATAALRLGRGARGAPRPARPYCTSRVSSAAGEAAGPARPAVRRVTRAAEPPRTPRRPTVPKGSRRRRGRRRGRRRSQLGCSGGPGGFLFLAPRSASSGGLSAGLPQPRLQGPYHPPGALPACSGGSSHDGRLQREAARWRLRDQEECLELSDEIPRRC